METFLNGDLDEEVFIEPPEGFDKKLEKNLALKSNKALYGLKHAPRAWNKKLVNKLKERMRRFFKMRKGRRRKKHG